MARDLVDPPDLHPAPGFSHAAVAVTSLAVPGLLIEIECTALLT